MMIESSSSGKGYHYHQATKQEGDDDNNNPIEKFNKALPSTSSSSSRQWTAFRNPRIVRVSRTMGGKDRHSKVCTIRGLRDRRIRLSVPTAIQLYDLQDRLGLTQPSKVIDWLLDATKIDIDNLPPLQIPQGCFPQFHQQQQHALLPGNHHELPSALHHQFSLAGGFYDGGNSNQINLLARSSRFWDMDLVARLKGKEEGDDDQGLSISEKGKWIKRNEEENQDGVGLAHKLFPIGSDNNNNNNSSLSSLLNINAMTYNNSYHNNLDPSNLTLSQFGSHGLLFPSQQLDPPQSHHHSSGLQFSSSIPSGSQLPFCPSSAPTPSPPLFTSTTPYAPFLMSSSMESDPRQFNHTQLLNSSSHIMPQSLFPPSIHSINSPLRRIPMPFSSKLLDSDINQRSSQQDHDDKGRNPS